VSEYDAKGGGRKRVKQTLKGSNGALICYKCWCCLCYFLLLDGMDLASENDKHSQINEPSEKIEGKQ
jgi:hypothetical protein